jgi:hypothetical protein
MDAKESALENGQNQEPERLQEPAPVEEPLAAQPEAQAPGAVPAADKEKVETVLTPEEKEEIRQAIDLINRLIVACKSFTLYPLNHPVAQNSLEMLEKSLNQFLEERGEFSLGIKQNSLVYRSWSLGSRNDAFRAFATTLRHLNISDFTVLPGITQEDLQPFLHLLIADPERVDLQGGIETQLFVAGVSHVTVVESEAREKDKDEEEAEDALSGGIKAVDLFDLLEDALKGFTQRVQELVNLMLQPEHLAFSLRNLSVRGVHISDLAQLVEGMYLFLKKAASVVDKEFPSKRAIYYRSMAEAILFLDTTVRNELLLRQMLPQMKDDPFSTLLLSQFNTQEISDVLSYFLPLAQELIPKTRVLLRLIGYSPDEVEEAVGMLKNKLIENGNVSPALVYALEAGMEHEDQDERKEPPRKLPTLEEVAEFFKEYSEDDIQAISAISDLDLELERLVESTPVLLNLFRRGEDINSLAEVFEQLEDNFWGLLKKEQLGLAALLLEEFKNNLGSIEPAYAPLRERIVLLVNEAASPAAIRSTIQKSSRNRENQLMSEGFKSYMRVLREDGVVAMINVLGDEEDMSVRKYINDVLVDLGRGYVGLFTMRLNDERWYLVRNLISILGRMRATEALPYLRQTFNHANPRVRAESIRSIGFIGGFEAGNILMEGLANPDPQTRMLCVRWLGRLEERRALNSLTHTLDVLKDNRQEDLELKKEIIITLGKVGNLDTFTALEKYRKMSKFGYREQWEEINIVAEQSLRQLSKRFPQARRRRDER